MDRGSTSFERKRKSSENQTPTKRARDAASVRMEGAEIHCIVRETMKEVNDKIPDENHGQLGKFIKSKIEKLESKKRETVGVLGPTGAGKSYLINTVLEEKKLLPVGKSKACTSAIIKVRNAETDWYEAEIEFIEKEEWQKELQTFDKFLETNQVSPMDEDRSDDDSNNEESETENDDEDDFAKKLSSVYGDDWKGKTAKNLMERKYFKEIPEFLQGRKKTLRCDSAIELSAQCRMFITNQRDRSEKTFWPLVKCVTFKVPKNDFLQHVTIMDLPGSGDSNKSRDEMWKEVVQSCSVVWIVTDKFRASSNKEAWAILKAVSYLMGNGGECRKIHYICTKIDKEDNSDDSDESTDGNVKQEVIDEFDKRSKKQFDNKNLEIFTVGSKAFWKKKELSRAENEIPKLQAFLTDLNGFNMRTLNYVSDAYGILSLVQGSRVSGKEYDLKEKLNTTIDREVHRIEAEMNNSYKALEDCLKAGVEQAKSSCESQLRSVLNKKPGGAFHKTLTSVVKKDGDHKPAKGKRINLNMILSSCLTKSIDETFKKTFPNERKQGAFNNSINRFSLETKMVTKKFQKMKLQLIFLQTEEEKMKREVDEIILKRKKKIYNSLTETVARRMKDCYRRAAQISGKDTLQKTRNTLMDHVQREKHTMFEEAKQNMLSQLSDLKEELLMKITNTLKESVHCSLTDDSSLPDVSQEYKKVKKFYKQLRASSEEEEG